MVDADWLSTSRASELFAEMLPGFAALHRLVHPPSPQKFRELCRDDVLAEWGIECLHLPAGYYVRRDDLLWMLRRAAVEIAENTATELGLTIDERLDETRKAAERTEKPEGEG